MKLKKKILTSFLALSLVFTSLSIPQSNDNIEASQYEYNWACVPGTNDTSSNVYANFNDDVTLSPEVHALNGYSVSYKWTTSTWGNPEAIGTSSTFKADTSNPENKTSLSRTYYCTVNFTNTSTSEVDDYQIITYYINLSEEIFAATKRTSKTTLYGSSCTLTCDAKKRNGEKPISYSWYTGEYVWYDDDNYEIKLNGEPLHTSIVNTFQIENVTKEEYYFCLAKFTDGQTYTTEYHSYPSLGLSISSPNLLINETSYRTFVGKKPYPTVSVNVEALTDCKISYEWGRNNLSDLNSPYDSNKIITTNNSYQLTESDISQRLGSITCIITAEKGDIKEIKYFTVKFEYTDTTDGNPYYAISSPSNFMKVGSDLSVTVSTSVSDNIRIQKSTQSSLEYLVNEDYSSEKIYNLSTDTETMYWINTHGFKVSESIYVFSGNKEIKENQIKYERAIQNNSVFSYKFVPEKNGLYEINGISSCYIVDSNCNPLAIDSSQDTSKFGHEIKGITYYEGVGEKYSLIKGKTYYIIFTKSNSYGKVFNFSITNTTECSHEFKTENAKEATCGSSGNTGKTYCVNCGYVKSNPKEISATGKHTWDDGKVTTEATITTEGVRTYTCKVCKAEKTEKIDKLVADTKPTPSAKAGEVVETKDTSAVYIAKEDGTVEYVAPAKKVKNVTIPATVKDANGNDIPVTSIAKNAFKNNKTITNVTVGKNVTTIGSNAFSGCTKLTKISLGSKVSSIGAKAFSGSKKLKTIVITNKKLNAKNINSKAFKGLSKTTVIDVPNKKIKEYQKLFRNKGLSKNNKIK